MRFNTIFCMLALSILMMPPVAQAELQTERPSFRYECLTRGPDPMPYALSGGGAGYRACGSITASCEWWNAGPDGSDGGTPGFWINVYTKPDPLSTLIICKGTINIDVVHWGGPNVRWANTRIGDEDPRGPASESTCSYNQFPGPHRCVTHHDLHFTIYRNLPHQALDHDVALVSVPLDVYNTQLVPKTSNTDLAPTSFWHDRNMLAIETKVTHGAWNMDLE